MRPGPETGVATGTGSFSNTSSASGVATGFMDSDGGSGCVAFAPHTVQNFIFGANAAPQDAHTGTGSGWDAGTGS
ncbi:MAG: hypothetical protein AAGU77_12905 [Bacillota bacterium]